MSRIIITTHSKDRLRTRASLSKKNEIGKSFKSALHSGKSPSEFVPPFSDYLKSKIRKGSQIKVYRNLIFIYKGKKLITAYGIPDKYQRLIDLENKYKNNVQLFKSSPNIELQLRLIKYIRIIYNMCHSNINICPTEEQCRQLVENSEKVYRVTIELIRRVIHSEPEDIRMVEAEDVYQLSELLKYNSDIFQTLTSDMVGFGTTKLEKSQEDMKADARIFHTVMNNIQFIAASIIESLGGDYDEYRKESNELNVAVTN